MAMNTSQKVAASEDTVCDFVLGCAPRSWRASGSRAQQLKRVFRNALDWPPDLFAIAWLVLQRTGAYRYVANPPEGLTWPPSNRWDEHVIDCSREWLAWSSSRAKRSKPRRLGEVIDTLCRLANSVTMGRLQYKHRLRGASKQAGPSWDAWLMTSTLLELLAISDQLCVGLGFFGPLTRAEREGAGLMSASDRCAYRVRVLANLLLSSHGSLSRIAKANVTVVPKMKTPQRGLNIRCMTHHLCGYVGETNLVWRAVPFTTLRSNSVSLLLVPHPSEIRPPWFTPSASTNHGRRRSVDWYFDYSPECVLDSSALADRVDAVRRSHGQVDLLVFPELALTAGELDRLQRELELRRKDLGFVPSILAGVRGQESTVEGKNYLAFSFFFAGKWYRSVQRKQHRWRLTRDQLSQYGLTGALSGAHDWWEDLSIQQRQQVILLAAPWLSIAPLVCEDLAQEDPSADMLRAIGPALVLAALLDGPQHPERWPGRHANVLADDPGSAVLTLTSFGMARVSRRSQDSEPPEGPVSVALWRDTQSSWRRLAQDANGVEQTLHFVTAAGTYVEEFTADGRGDGCSAVSLRLRQHSAIPTGISLVNGLSAAAADTRKTDEWPIATGDAAALDLRELSNLVFLCDYLLACGIDETVNLLQLLVSGANPSEVRYAHENPRWFRGGASEESLLGAIRHLIVRRAFDANQEGSAKREMQFAVLRMLNFIEDVDQQSSAAAGMRPRTSRWREIARQASARLELAESLLRASRESDRISKHLQFAAREYKLGPREASHAERVVATVVLYCSKARIRDLIERGVIESDDEACLVEIDELFRRAAG